MTRLLGATDPSPHFALMAPDEGTSQRDQRTDFAADRTVLAAERTFSAWLRTGLGAVAVGVAAARLLGEVRPPWLTMAIADGLLAFGALAAGVGLWRFRHLRHAVPNQDVRCTPLWLATVLAALVIAAAAAGVVVVGVSGPDW